MFGTNEQSELLSPPQKDFRNFSLPGESFPVSSPSSPTWRSFNDIKTARKKDNPLKFLDETAGNPLSPIEDFIDEQCLHFEENFVKIGDFESKFFEGFANKNIKKLEDYDDDVFRSLTHESKETLVGSGLICRKCGHDILKL